MLGLALALGVLVGTALAATGDITTIAGDGTAGFAGDDGAATSANLDDPRDVAIDGDGNLLIADTANNRIRKVDLSSGVITTFAGSARQ